MPLNKEVLFTNSYYDRASIDYSFLSDAQVLSDIRKIVGDFEYVPTDPKQLCNTLLVTCYMGTENSSSDTKAKASELASEIGSYHHSIVIDVAISAILGIFHQVTKLKPRFKAQGGSPRENLALQNIQVLEKISVFNLEKILNLEFNEVFIPMFILRPDFGW